MLYFGLVIFNVLLFSDFERDFDCDFDCDFDMAWSGLGDFDAYFEGDSA